VITPPTTDDTTFWGALATGIGGAYAATRWWYHVRRMENADKVDGGVSKSIGFVLDELRTSMMRLEAENKELRAKIEHLEVLNDALRVVRDASADR